MVIMGRQCRENCLLVSLNRSEKMHPILLKISSKIIMKIVTFGISSNSDQEFWLKPHVVATPRRLK